MYILLILSLIFLLFLCYVVFHGDIMCPAIVTLSVFLFSAVVGLSRYNDWFIEDYSGISVFLILIGFFSFIGSCLFIDIIFKGNRNKIISGQTVIRNRVEINNILLGCIIVLQILQGYIYYKFIERIADFLGMSGNSLGETVQITRLFLSHGEVLEALRLPAYFSAINILTSTFVTVSIFVLVYNISLQEFKKRDFLLLLVVCLDLFINFLKSNRGAIFGMFAEVLYLLFFFRIIRYGWKKSVSIQIVKFGIKSFAIILAVFLQLAIFTGRYASIDDIDIVNYMTIYISSGIRNFDLFAKDFYSESSIFGKETFYAINRFLYNRFGIGEFYLPFLEFRAINGKNIGNIYTVFRRYYADFGITGIILLPTVLGSFFSYLYNKAKYSAIKGKISFAILLYSFLSVSLFYFPIDDVFFEYNFAINRFVMYIFLYAFFCFFVKRNKEYN